MCFKKRKKKQKKQVSLRTTSVIIHQLSNEELQNQKKGINHFGAVFNINLMEKEDILMVEKLKAYRAELEAKRTELVNLNINVEPEVEAYRERLIAEAEAHKAANIAKIDSDINCIDGIIAREEAAEVTVNLDAVEPVPAE